MSKRQSQARKKNLNSMQTRMAMPCAVIECTRAAVTDPWEHNYLGIMPYRKALALRRHADKATLALPLHQMQQGGLLGYTDLLVEGRADHEVQSWVSAHEAGYKAGKHFAAVMRQCAGESLARIDEKAKMDNGLAIKPHIAIAAYRPLSEEGRSPEAVLVPVFVDGKTPGHVAIAPRAYKHEVWYRIMLKVCDGKPVWLYGQEPSPL